MPNPAVGADVHQPLDVHRDLGAQRALDAILLLDDAAEAADVHVGQVADPLLAAHAGLVEDIDRVLAADAIDVRQPNLDLLVARKIDAGNTSHMLALTLLVLGVALADHASDAIALDDLAMLADRLHAGADFHGQLRSRVKSVTDRP
jgi:hypothetical protein